MRVFICLEILNEFFEGIELNLVRLFGGGVGHRRNAGIWRENEGAGTVYASADPEEVRLN